ncbi:MAG: hypothetical protein CM15mP54_20490 [Paracoccaceae bacterium]|nr:MAG: hypothetical protein CM15mP54_20490 [Paracoccaceae bacterium]
MADQIYPPSAEFVANAKINKADYDNMYAESINNEITSGANMVSVLIGLNHIQN